MSPRRSQRDASERHLQRVAYHEAGHVVAFMHGHRARRLKRVTIVPDVDTLGRVEHWPLPRWFRPDIRLTAATIAPLEDEIVISLAGSTAEKRFAGRADHVGAERDYQTALSISDYLCRTARSSQALIRYLEIVTDELIESYWAEVEAVAGALLEHRTLNHEQVRAVIEFARGHA